ncbi:cyclin-dependent kinase 2-interacting protein [Kryptolebias marmoratus]|uniref:Cyclin dependent kinase 2 interacting protein n=1 Tax=Kryptolebias marmoratus TaxID=37003 RepID=A0A3Q3A480_KRYMA|nr:cyclin-dependent kinase 2-interacting protein [Kryptolebias marmoratus]
MEGGPADAAANRKSSALTGSARKLKDNAADWHNLMLRWDKLNEEGFNVAANIVNTRRSQRDLWTPDESPPSDELQAECSKLQDVVHKMVAVVTKMEHLMELQRGVQELEEFQFGPEGRTVPLFHSWTTKDFEENCGVLMVDFRQELRLKLVILEELAHAVNSDLSMVYLSCWLHQPFIRTQTRLRLEALLLETGHRPV